MTKPALRILDEGTIVTVLAEARRILAEIGIEVRLPALKERLLAYGLSATPAGDRIRFPPDVVERAIRAAPQTITLFDRRGAPHTTLGGDAVHFVPASSALNILDGQSGQIRRPTTADFVRYARLADGLPHLSYLATAFSTADIDPAVSDAWRLYLCLTQSAKPVVSGAFTRHGVPLMARMLALFRPSRADLAARPMAVFTITPGGLFSYGEDTCQNLLDCLDWGIPIEVVPVTLMGLIAPVTVVDAAIFHVADVLAGLTMAQLLKPGHPVLFGGAPATFHMQTTAAPMAAIEAMQVILAYVDVAQHLNLPTQAYIALSDSPRLDAQAGAETFGGALLAALARINVATGPGMLDYARTFSLEKLVLDDDLCGQALHLIRPLTAPHPLPALDLARQVLADQHLLVAEHTHQHWPAELYLPSAVIDRQNRDSQLAGEYPVLPDRARREVETRLAAYTPRPVDPALERELRRLLLAALDDGAALPPVA
ncbi:MAG: trimethylamine methyltransferase family protein [Anaerolineae bacterium]